MSGIVSGLDRRPLAILLLVMIGPPLLAALGGHGWGWKA
jgi:hypothetical protein